VLSQGCCQLSGKKIGPTAELTAFASDTYDRRVSSNSRGSLPRLLAFSPEFSRVSAHLLPWSDSLDFETGPVTFGPQTSLEKNFRLSPQRVPAGLLNSRSFRLSRK